VAASGHELLAYPMRYIEASGMNPKQPGDRVNAGLHCVHLMITYDDLNPYNLAFAEHLARRLVVIQRAVKRNQLAPDFDGLEILG
jgi:hypothetical protein